MPLRLLLLILLLSQPAAAGATGLPGPATALGDGVVVEVVDGRTLRLADGRVVRLTGLAPAEGAAADLARQALAGLVQDQMVSMHQAGRDRRQDRHGRVLAHLLRCDGTWVQAEMLRRGAARVAPAEEERAMIPALLAVEAGARTAAQGVWAEAATAVRTADTLDSRADAGGYHLVEGKVLSASRRGEMVYLNFGTDWRRDFTVEVPARDLRRFAGAGLDPLGLSGRRVRVRGLVEARNGPAIRANHPQQIELLAP